MAAGVQQAVSYHMQSEQQKGCNWPQMRHSAWLKTIAVVLSSLKHTLLCWVQAHAL